MFVNSIHTIAKTHSIRTIAKTRSIQAFSPTIPTFQLQKAYKTTKPINNTHIQQYYPFSFFKKNNNCNSKFSSLTTATTATATGSIIQPLIIYTTKQTVFTLNPPTPTEPLTPEELKMAEEEAQKKLELAEKLEKRTAQIAFLAENLKVTHEPDHQRFMIYPDDLNTCWKDLDDGKRHTDEPAKLLYTITNFDQKNDDNDNDDSRNTKAICDFTHTYCPPAFRGGTGVSEYIVETGLQWASKQGYEIKGSCWYVAKFLPFNNQQQDNDNNVNKHENDQQQTVPESKL